MALSPLGIALMQTQTQPAPARPGSVSPTDVLGAYQLSSNMAEQQYQAKLAQQNALWGGLAGLGAAGIIGGSKVPAITSGISNLISPTAAAAPAAGTIGAAATDFGSSYPLAGLGADAFAPGASVASDLAAATPAVADAGTSALSGFGAAIPFLSALFAPVGA